MDYSMDLSGTRELSPLVNYTGSDYVPEPYTVPSAISATHNQPRYGFTNNFGALIDGNSNEQQDYVLGIIIGAMIILGVAILWFLAIVVLKILGQKKVGFFAGRLVRPGQSLQGTEGNEEKGGVEVVMEGDQPSNGDNDDDISEAVPMNGTNNTVDDKHVKKFKRTVWAVRGMFVLSGIFVIISGGLFYGKGVVSFKNSIDEVRLGIDLVQTAALKTIALTENVLQAEDDIEQEMKPTREVVQSSGQICGLDSELSTQVRNAYDAFTTNVDSLSSMLDDSLQSFGDDLRSLMALTEKIDSGLDSADIFFYILISISIIIIGLILAMLAGAFFAWKGVSNCFTKCIQYAIIWPLFVFFLVLSWIFATLFLTFSLAGADFCYSPDQYMEELLTRNEDMFDGIIFGFILFYVSGCTIKPQGAEDMIEIAAQVKVVVFHAHDLTELLGGMSIDRISLICGLSTEEATALSTIIEFSHQATHLLNRAMVGLREVLACETFNPIYTTFVHKAFCVEGVSGLKYIFSTTLIISIFSMVMIMFRAALYPIKEPVSRSEDAMEVVKYNENSPGEENAEVEKAVIY